MIEKKMQHGLQRRLHQLLDTKSNDEVPIEDAGHAFPNPDYNRSPVNSNYWPAYNRIRNLVGDMKCRDNSSHLSLGKKRRQLGLHGRVLSSKQHTRGTLVKSVDDAGAQGGVVLSVLAINVRRKFVVLLLEVVHEGVHEGSVPAARGRVHHHSRGLVDSDDLVIFEQNLLFSVAHNKKNDVRLENTRICSWKMNGCLNSEILSDCIANVAVVCRRWTSSFSYPTHENMTDKRHPRRTLRRVWRREYRTVVMHVYSERCSC